MAYNAYYERRMVRYYCAKICQAPTAKHIGDVRLCADRYIDGCSTLSSRVQQQLRKDVAETAESCLQTLELLEAEV